MIERTPAPPGSPSAELIHACIEGNLVGVLEALRNGANPNAWRENEGPAIHSALSWPRIVEALIEAGAEPHARNFWSERPLEKLASDYLSSEHPVERGRMEQTARLLMRLGGNPYRASPFWRTGTLRDAMPQVVAEVEAEQREALLQQRLATVADTPTAIRPRL
ncbi:hypothetical protein GXB84_06105 [Stenotrophomonas acidaminiphila]|uniref:hypothetical protein n=1 Tax=Stenotrophomonas acidaminiphila TaxID=128780 RepID=UPI00137577C2|nr:hypothetical protein [Stenotrophomonas acidaminiphila]NCT86902.1 hypothetical protein [Stenotrophomonas acidaminiphila]